MHHLVPAPCPALPCAGVGCVWVWEEGGRTAVLPTPPSAKSGFCIVVSDEPSYECAPSCGLSPRVVPSQNRSIAPLLSARPGHPAIVVLPRPFSPPASKTYHNAVPQARRRALASPPEMSGSRRVTDLAQAAYPRNRSRRVARLAIGGRGVPCTPHRGQVSHESRSPGGGGGVCLMDPSLLHPPPRPDRPARRKPHRAGACV